MNEFFIDTDVGLESASCYLPAWIFPDLSAFFFEAFIFLILLEVFSPGFSGDIYFLGDFNLFFEAGEGFKEN
jgi:hypothetical protein